MSIARAKPGAIVLNDKLYVIGGKMQQQTVSDSMECYSFEHSLWRKLAPMPYPVSNMGVRQTKVTC